MSDLFYWNNWQSPYKWLAHCLVFIFFTLIILTLTLVLFGEEYAMGWHVYSTQDSFDAVAHTFQVGPFSFSIHATKQYITEFFGGASINTGLEESYAFLFIIGISIVVLLTVITYLPRFWYLVCMGIAIMFFTFLHVEMLQLWEWMDKKAMIFVFVLFAVPSYAIHAFYKEWGLLKRLAIFLGVTVVFVVVISAFSKVINPFHVLTSYGIYSPYFLSFLFILMVSHEIVNTILKVTTQSSKYGVSDASGVKHFIILTLIYLANILLSYLHKTHVIDWDFVYINPFLLLGVSAIIGLWGLKLRSTVIENILKFYPLTVMFYLALGLVCFGTICYLSVTLNDPMIRIISDLIIYAHLGYGIFFLLYVIINFMPLLQSGKEVYKVVYKPTNMPYFTYRFAGLITILALVLARNIDYPISYSEAGYYNGVADLYLAKGDEDLAETFYTEAMRYGHDTHKGNYMLGVLAKIKDDHVGVKMALDKAINRVPSPQAFINLSNLHKERREYFKSLFVLQSGIEAFPESEHIANNLALLYRKVNISDSTTYYLNKIKNTEAGNVNLIASLAISGQSVDADSILEKSKLSIPEKANLMALQPTYDLNIKADSVLNMYGVATLNNWLLTNNADLALDTLAARAIDSLLVNPSNSSSSEQLSYSLALAKYISGDVSGALSSLHAMALNSESRSAEFFESLGLMYLEQGGYHEAASFFETAVERGRTSAWLKLGVALMESGQLESANDVWDTLRVSGNEELKTVSTTMLNILKIENIDKAKNFDDYEKYLVLRYHRSNYDEIELLRILKNMKDPNYKAKAVVDMALYYFMVDNEYATNLFLEQFESVSDNISLLRAHDLLKLRILAKNKDASLKEALEIFEKTHGFEKSERGMQWYLELKAGEQLEEVHYQYLATKNPFFQEGVIAASRYRKESSTDEFDCYNTLVNAVLINTHAVKLYKEYILEALNMGLENYASDALAKFSEISPGQQYAVISQAYNEKKAAIELQINEDLDAEQ